MEKINIKKIIERVIGNDDPFWNDPVYTIVKKIIDLPEGQEFIISNLLDDKKIYYDKDLAEINKIVIEVCKKIKIQLDKSNQKNEDDGLSYNITFVKKTLVLKCPKCNNKLSYLMPDGKYLYCDRCNKYYLNNNGNVGKETCSPTYKKDCLY